MVSDLESPMNFNNATMQDGFSFIFGQVNLTSLVRVPSPANIFALYVKSVENIDAIMILCLQKIIAPA